MDSSTLTLRSYPFPLERVSGYSFIITMFIEIPIFNANSIDSDQRPRSAASDLCLHCLQMSHLRGAGHKWVKDIYFFVTLAE